MWDETVWKKEIMRLRAAPGIRHILGAGYVQFLPRRGGRTQFPRSVSRILPCNDTRSGNQ